MVSFLRNDRLVVGLFFIGAVLLGFISVLVINRGVFTYMLDDPYIHLAVAEELAQHGTYGVNPGESSAPCSSPLWPFLMVPFAKLPCFVLAPFFLSVAAGLATALLALGRIRRWFPQDALTLLPAGITIAFLLATNIIGLVFTGMEHSLQVLLAVVVIEGMLRLAEGAKPTGWVQLAVVIGPWIRYENLALTLPYLAMLFLTGKRTRAVALGFTALSGLIAFSAYLISLNLSPIPASIQAKSSFTDQNFLYAALHNIKLSLAHGRGTLVAILVSILLGIAIAWKQGGIWRLTACLMACAGALHLVAGAYGWVNRYEIYIIAGLIWGLAGTAAAFLRAADIRPGPRFAWAVLPLVPTIGLPYFQGLAVLPLACNNIYEQQYQMHRFVVDFWRKPVAVNDLGYVAFENPQYVLDLWGLASIEALKARLHGEPTGWMSDLSKRHDVGLAMVYAPWFQNRPPEWKPIAVLRLSRKLITPAWNEVTFYATSADYSSDIKDTILRFRSSLPQGVVIEDIVDPNSKL